MIDAELRAHIRRLFFAEHWKIGTIADQLGLHHQTVRRALETGRFNRCKIVRSRVTDPYVEFIRQTLEQYPRLRATRIYQMICPRGYTGSVVTLPLSSKKKKLDYCLFRLTPWKPIWWCLPSRTRPFMYASISMTIRFPPRP